MVGKSKRYLAEEHALLLLPARGGSLDTARFPGRAIPWAQEWVALTRPNPEALQAASREGSVTRFRGLPQWPEELLQEYEERVLQGKLPTGTYTVWSFGYTPELAEELLGHVLTGQKRATCGSLAAYEAEGEAIPKVGDLSVVLDGDGIPGAVIRTVDCALRPFGEVDEQFAYEEGEGDRSYRYWREAHERFFRFEAGELGYRFSDELPLVCERFELVDRF